MYTPVNPNFTILKWDVRGYKLYGCVITMFLYISIAIPMISPSWSRKMQKLPISSFEIWSLGFIKVPVWFEGWIGLLIALVPGLCIPFTLLQHEKLLLSIS